ncbi:AMP-ligase [Lysobacter pythonis]|uniref:AMP-ligase n=1 Tax=Solilutibacter pythonis TaxID=2483112 RepID=A0A3M2HVH8_9GAMM|nr:AMP-binding protein [Lysobacter pythonis]RMH93736.1 AMP-ligase [Lysobacter pythonis]
MSAEIISSALAACGEWLAGDDDAWLFCGPRAMTRGRFRRRVAALAGRLPEAPSVINLCEHRDHFLLAFCAALVRGQVTLLPPSRAADAVAEVAARHPGCSRLADLDGIDCDLRVDRVAAAESGIDTPPRALADARLAMIGFTSGSTGAPSAHPKTWGALRHTDAANQRWLQVLCGGGGNVVATVPPQHMYGLELSVLLPLLGPFAVHPGRPFFPQDVAKALAECAEPRLLVTTPLHLHALVESGVELPPLAGIVSATAPLTPALAEAAEARFATELHEVFGATEVCVFAYRRSTQTSRWRLLDEVRLSPRPGGTLIARPSLPSPVLLADLLELVDDGNGFELRGRHADLLEIAGKRASMADLTRRLQAIPGVRDAAMLQLDADAAGVRRLVAVVAADASLANADILAAMRRVADPVFLPRRIVRVDALPRNETGKLPRQALLALVERG